MLSAADTRRQEMSAAVLHPPYAPCPSKMAAAGRPSGAELPCYERAASPSFQSSWSLAHHSGEFAGGSSSSTSVPKGVWPEAYGRRGICSEAKARIGHHKASGATGALEVLANGLTDDPYPVNNKKVCDLSSPVSPGRKTTLLDEELPPPRGNSRPRRRASCEQADWHRDSSAGAVMRADAAQDAAASSRRGSREVTPIAMGHRDKDLFRTGPRQFREALCPRANPLQLPAEATSRRAMPYERRDGGSEAMEVSEGRVLSETESGAAAESRRSSRPPIEEHAMKQGSCARRSADATVRGRSPAWALPADDRPAAPAGPRLKSPHWSLPADEPPDLAKLEKLLDSAAVQVGGLRRRPEPLGDYQVGASSASSAACSPNAFSQQPGAVKADAPHRRSPGVSNVLDSASGACEGEAPLVVSPRRLPSPTLRTSHCSVEMHDLLISGRSQPGGKARSESPRELFRGARRRLSPCQLERSTDADGLGRGLCREVAVSSSTKAYAMIPHNITPLAQRRHRSAEPCLAAPWAEDSQPRRPMRRLSGQMRAGSACSKGGEMPARTPWALDDDELPATRSQSPPPPAPPFAGHNEEAPPPELPRRVLRSMSPKSRGGVLLSSRPEVMNGCAVGVASAARAAFALKLAASANNGGDAAGGPVSAAICEEGANAAGQRPRLDSGATTTGISPTPRVSDLVMMRPPGRHRAGSQDLQGAPQGFEGSTFWRRNLRSAADHSPGRTLAGVATLAIGNGGVVGPSRRQAAVPVPTRAAVSFPEATKVAETASRQSTHSTTATASSAVPEVHLRSLYNSSLEALKHDIVSLQHEHWEVAARTQRFQHGNDALMRISDAPRIARRGANSEKSPLRGAPQAGVSRLRLASPGHSRLGSRSPSPGAKSGAA
eukprot:TRINITY_DN32079_c0_g1_i4.p1 TRINITY_DN32079_c0_g1~~TRINITY_DN32079_c0_g1_i4.p1  ORF type:complete len:892 (+),score=145.56 TRINITY_DN32079_c0_g1_i4:57-2732(+)